MIWLILTPGGSGWRFVRAEPPCWKGEVSASILSLTLTVGWQAQKHATEAGKAQVDP